MKSGDLLFPIETQITGFAPVLIAYERAGIIFRSWWTKEGFAIS
jgi:hypothetical protein